MTIKLTVPTVSKTGELKPRISVIGVGGAGGNAVNNMIQMGLEGVEFIVANSDAQALSHTAAERKIQMGTEVTKGLGAGSNPNIGRAAAEESLDEIITHLHDVNMVFVTAGLGGGTGTGASPVIAKMARENGILTVGVVTKPFQFEGANRMKIAEEGLEELQQYVDTLLIIPNQNLFRVANENTTFADAFKMADDVLYSGVRGVTDLMVMPGLINLDFADIKSVMSEMGKAMMGTGEAEGERRAIDAAEAAIANPLLDDISMSGAKGVLINITAGKDITLFEVDEAANRIRDEVAENANIIFGSTFEETLEGCIRVSVVATGIESAVNSRGNPVMHTMPNLANPIANIPDSSDATSPVEMPMTADTTILPTNGEKSVGNKSDDDSQSETTDQEDLIEYLDESKKVNTDIVDQPDVVQNNSLDDNFIPAPPVDGASSHKIEADPFAAADMINAGAEKERKKESKKTGISLIERVTRVTLGDRRSEAKKRITPSELIKNENTENVDVLKANPSVTDEELGLRENSAGSMEASRPYKKKGLDEIGKDLEQIFETPTQSEAKDLVRESKHDNTDSLQGHDGGEPNKAPTLLNGIDANEMSANDGVDTDLLDIPAFLRRQAN